MLASLRRGSVSSGIGGVWNGAAVSLALLVTLGSFPGDLIRTPRATAADYYVNNCIGRDNNDGKTAKTAVKTIAKAVSLCHTSDRIVLANTGTVYHESLCLSRRGGTPQRPFVIEGNGAVLSGLRAVKPDEWQPMADGRYFFPVANRPYGMPYLASHGKRLAVTSKADTIGPGEYFWDREKGIYFKPAADQTLASYDLGVTLLGSGLATASASYIVCRNLVCEHFANDGFNMHGDCRGITLENVVARYNGDDGISIHESGGLVVRDAHVHHNTFGVQDVNASQSFYNGVLAEHNQVGASFAGGFHTLTDCVIRDSKQDQIDLVAAYPKHLIGSEQNPLCRTMLFAKNLLLQGPSCRAGVRIRRGAQAIIETSAISGGEVGICVHEEGSCHFTRSVIADCQVALVADSTAVFCDYNVYSSAVMKWLGTDYGPDQWQSFREQTSSNDHSQVGPVTVAPGGTIQFPPDSPARAIEKAVGPTQALQWEPKPQ